ncbi:hypothetical protein JCM8097_003059 [Rhodosporidiobolus ruineniae]
MLRASLSIAALIAGGASVDASPISARATASIPQTVAGYSYKGCYSDLTNGGTRVLPLSLGNPNNTVEGCISVAAKNGYSLAGIEYYGECWVGNELHSSSQVQGDAACNLVCWGDSKEFCGGQGGSTGAAMQLYSLPATNSTVAPLTPTTNPTNTTTTATVTATTAPIATPTFVKSYTSGSQNWTRSGCQSDLRYGTRALPNQLAQIKTRTVEGCLDACTSAGYSLCGVEWDGECWGANSLDSTSIALDDSACNKACADDATEICGGTGGESGAAFQLFKTVSVPTNTSTTTAPSATPTAETDLPQGGSVVETVNSEAGPAWSNNGCYGDLKYGTRALPNLLAQATDGTVEGCVNACQEAGYSLCGVEYQGECWAGDAIDVTSSQVDDSVCNLSCSGDASQRCGGSQAAGTPGIAPFGASFQLYAQCGDNVATCDLINATSCSGEYVLYDGACDDTVCPDGWFNDNQVCKQCNSVDKTCTSLTNATACVDGHVLYKNACELTECPQTTFDSNSTCLDCPAGALTCSDAKTAETCDVEKDYYLTASATCTQDCSTLGALYGDANGTCTACSDSKATSCSSATVSTACSTGYHVSNDVCTIDCVDVNAASCSADGKTATVCNSSYFLTSTGTCTKSCSSLGAFFNDVTKCTACSDAKATSCSSAAVSTGCSTGYSPVNGKCTLDCNVANALTCSAANYAATCKTGYSPSNGACAMDCNVANVLTCSAPNYAATCKTGYSPSSGACAVNCNVSNALSCSAPNYANSCKTGFKPSGGACVPNCTDPNATSCSADGKTATKCNPSYNLWLSKGTCVSQCPDVLSADYKTPATYVKNQQCITCSGVGAPNACTYFDGIPYVKQGTGANARCVNGYTACKYGIIDGVGSLYGMPLYSCHFGFALS